MSKRTAVDFMTLDDIRALFKKHLQISIQRTGVYHYIDNFGFPPSTGWGRPRRWDAEKVRDWFTKNQNK